MHNKTDEFMEYAAERYMNHIKHLERNINVALASVASARNKLDIAGVSYEDHVKGSCTDSAIPDGLSKLEVALNEAETELQGYNEEMEQAKKAIRALDNELYRCVLKCRYILDLNWCHTAKALGYSESHAKSLRRPALIALYPHIPEEWKTNLPNAEIRDSIVLSN